MSIEIRVYLESCNKSVLANIFYALFNKSKMYIIHVVVKKSHLYAITDCKIDFTVASTEQITFICQPFRAETLPSSFTTPSQ